MWGTTTTAPTGGAESTPAEEYRTTLKRLREKEVDLLLQLEGHPAAPHRLRYELALVREMVRDTQAALRRLRPQRPRVRRYSLEGQSWQWLEKQSWDRLESMDRDNRERLEWMRAVVDDGTSEMTARQRQVFDLVYRAGKEVKKVAEELGVDPSTISRTARRAVEKLRRYAEGRELVRTCTRPDGSLELRRVVEEGQKRGEIRGDVSIRTVVKYYAMCERALVTEWCLGKGSYSLGEYSREYFPVMMEHFRGTGNP